MSSVPEGRAANQQFSATTLSPPIGAPFPGARVKRAVIGCPARVEADTASGARRASAARAAADAGASMRVYAEVPSSPVISR